MVYVSIFVEQVEVLLSQFEWKSRDSPTETRLRTAIQSFVTPANFPRAVTVRGRGARARMAITSRIRAARGGGGGGGVGVVSGLRIRSNSSHAGCPGFRPRNE